VSSRKHVSYNIQNFSAISGEIRTDVTSVLSPIDYSVDFAWNPNWTWIFQNFILQTISTQHKNNQKVINIYRRHLKIVSDVVNI